MESALDKLIRLTRVTVPAHDRRDPRTGRTQHVGTYSYERHGSIGGGIKARAGRYQQPALAPKLFGDFTVEQEDAQAAADSAWLKKHADPLGENPDAVADAPPSPERSWGAYQLPGGYPAINQYLRSGAATSWKGESGRSLAANMIKAFDTMGHTTSKPGTVYRAIDVSDQLPLTGFKVGDVFTDKGVISTAASTDGIAQFVDGKPGQHAMLAINVPAGTRVLGGADGSFETMLKPGTRLRVVAAGEQKRIGGKADLYGEHVAATTLPTITMEALPGDGDFTSLPPAPAIGKVKARPRSRPVSLVHSTYESPTATRTGESVIPPRTLSSTGKSRPPKKLRL